MTNSSSDQKAVVRQENGELTESTLHHERQDADRRRSDKEVEHSSEESFPASDPPSGWAGTAEADTAAASIREVITIRPLDEDEEMQLPKR